jgi:hypothetical protein
MAMLPWATVETTGGKKQVTTAGSQRAPNHFTAETKARRQRDRAAVETDDGRLLANITKTPLICGCGPDYRHDRRGIVRRGSGTT